MGNKSAFRVVTPEQSPGLLLWQTTITWQRLIKEALADYDVTHPQFVILAILLWFSEKKQVVNQTMITDVSKLDKMTISQSLKKLAASTLVSRREHETDTRAKSVFLTKQGKTLSAKLVGIVESIDSDFFGRLNKNDKTSLLTILRNLNHE
jgi:DNA-binding MarR family transcriptional regulator